MHLLLLSNYYYPETVGAAIWITQLAEDLAARGHQVTVVTSFPSYPEGRISPSYRGQWHQRETIRGIEVIRTLTYATTEKTFWPRSVSFGTFCASSLVEALRIVGRFDAVYAILPPLPLGISGWALAKATGAKLVVNIQDIYPDIAEATGFLTNKHALNVFRRMERWIYGHAERIVVISDGFRVNLESKRVPRGRIAVVPNWADARAIVPLDRMTPFRREIGIGEGKFLVMYSGGLSLNSDLAPLIDAAAMLDPDRFEFVIAGEGARKAALMEQVAARKLPNIRFLPFTPFERYGEALSSADVTVVALHAAATFASVPSKIFKQMAAARPILAITNPGNELDRLIAASGCGVVVPPADSPRIAAHLAELAAAPEHAAAMGMAGRAYLERECTRDGCVAKIEEILKEVVGQGISRMQRSEAAA